MTGPAANRAPSSIDAIGEAISHMRAKLFPFSFVGWITLGFVSLLESCGIASGSNGIRSRFNGSDRFEDPARLVESAFGWIATHAVFFVGILVAAMLFSLVMMWLRSRAIFVYIDDVASGRFDLVRPWNAQGGHADSFFLLSLVVEGASFILVVLVVGLGGFFLLWARTNDWAGPAMALATIPLLLVFIASVVFAVVLNMALRDFVAPLQVIRGASARDAGGLFLDHLASRPGLFIGYALLKFVVGIAVGVVVFVVSCLTCCIAALPLINQTLFQPVIYAERAWSLRLLAQLGEDVFEGPKGSEPEPSEFEPSDAPTGPIDLSAIDFEAPPQG